MYGTAFPLPATSLPPVFFSGGILFETKQLELVPSLSGSQGFVAGHLPKSCGKEELRGLPDAASTQYTVRKAHNYGDGGAPWVRSARP